MIFRALLRFLSAGLPAGSIPILSVAARPYAPIPPRVSPVIDLTGAQSGADIGRLQRQALASRKNGGGRLPAQ